MDVSKSPLKLGLTVDLGNYGNNPQIMGEYIKWFADDTSGDCPKILHVYMIDRHIHSKSGIFDSDDVARLEDRLGNFSLFLEKFPQVEVVSFQFPYNQIPPELKCVERMDQLYGSQEGNTQRKRFLGEGKIVDIEKAHEMIFSFLNLVSKTDFSSLKSHPIVLFHAGGVLANDLISRDFDDDYLKFISLRRILLDDQLDYHKRLLYDINGKRVILGLENIPIWDSQTDFTCFQWLSEHCFEDFKSRLYLGGIHTIDIPHLAMDSHYYSQNELRFFSMEMLRREFNGVPKSLISLESYIRIASGFFKEIRRSTSEIVYHIADCNGLYLDNEGVQIGAIDSVIDWRNLVETIRRHTPSSYGAIEVQHGHIKENYDSHVRSSLRNFLSYCD